MNESGVPVQNPSYSPETCMVEERCSYRICKTVSPKTHAVQNSINWLNANLVLKVVELLVFLFPVLESALQGLISLPSLP